MDVFEELLVRRDHLLQVLRLAYLLAQRLPRTLDGLKQEKIGDDKSKNKANSSTKPRITSGVNLET